MSPGAHIVVIAWAGLAGMGLLVCLTKAILTRNRSRLRWTAGAFLFGLAASAGLWGYFRQAPQESRARYYAALDDKRRGNLEAAREKLQEALQLNPGDPLIRQEMKSLSTPQTSTRRESSLKPVLDAGTGAKVKPRHPYHEPSPVMINGYRIEMTLWPDRHTFSAKGELLLKARNTASRIPLALGPEFQVTKALSQDGKPIQAEHTNDLLILKDGLRKDEEKRYTLHWERIRKGERLSGGDAISVQGTYLRPESRWYPSTGELDFRSPVEIDLAVPRGYTGVSVGKRVRAASKGRMVTTVWKTGCPAAMIPLVAGRYAVKSRNDRGVELSAYLFPKHADRAELYLREAQAILDFYASRFGPYPYEKMAIAEIPFFPGGYGSTSLLMLTEASFEEKKLPVSFLAHEIAHQWWGNSVFPQGPGCGWLSEAFAEYSSFLYMEHKGGKSALKSCLQTAAKRYWGEISRGYEEPISQTDPYHQVGAYRGVIYSKGAYVLHSLRYLVGEEAFFSILRTLAARHAHGKVDIETFIRLCEEKAGRSLKDFFDAWLNRSGAMRLAYRYETKQIGSGDSEVALTLKQEGTVYPGPLEVALATDRGRFIRKFELSAPEQTFVLKVSGTLSSLDFDPEDWWLKYTPRWVRDAGAVQAVRR